MTALLHYSISQNLTKDEIILIDKRVVNNPIEESRIRINRNYLQIADIPASKVDKIILTDDKIKEFNNLALQKLI